MSVEVARKEQKESKQTDFRMSIGRSLSERPSSPAVWASRTGAQDSGQAVRALSTSSCYLSWFSVSRLTPSSMSAEGTAPIAVTVSWKLSGQNDRMNHSCSFRFEFQQLAEAPAHASLG